MLTWLVDNPLTVLLLVFFLAALIYLLWLRYRMAASKARFALATITAMTTCAMGLVAFLSGPAPVQIINAVSVALGLRSVSTATEGPGWFSATLGFLLTMAVVWLIYRFSSRALLTWEGPITVNVNDLAKREQDNNLVLLALAEFGRFVQRKSDPIASDAAINWKQRQSEAPARPPWYQFARNLFTTAYGEAQFADSGWRDRHQLWTGEIYLDRANTAPLLLLVFDFEPTDEDLTKRMEEFVRDGGDVLSAKIFAVFSEGASQEERVAVVFNHNVEIFPQRLLLRRGLKLAGYARDLIKRFENETLGGTTATLSKTFVEAHVLKQGSEKRHRLSKILDEWLIDSTRRHLAITGEYGQGKSTAMLEFCVRWARNYLDNGAIGERIPLLVELRGQNPAETDPVTFLSAWAGVRYPDLRPQQLYNLIKAGEAIVIFEGFDELRNAGRAYDRHEHFNALWRMAFPGTKLIFTGRPNFFLDEQEKNRTLRSDDLRGAMGNAYTEPLMLDRLTEGEVERVANGFGRELGTAIMGAVTAHSTFLDIVSRPSMLPVVATIWETITKLRERGHDLTGAILIELYLQAIYRRKEAEIERDRRESLAPEDASYLLLPREVREVFTLAVVWRMAGSDARNTISRASFNAVVAQIYDDVLRAFQKDGISTALTQSMRKFEERFKDESRGDRLERVSNEIASAGLFVPDPAGGSSNLRLPHKQFYEYMIAKAGWVVLAHPESLTTKIFHTADRSRAPLAKLSSEDLPIYFFSEIMGTDFSVFRAWHVRYILTLSILYYKAANFLVNRGLLGRNATIPKYYEKDDRVYQTFLRDIGRNWISIVGPIFGMAGVIVGTTEGVFRMQTGSAWSFAFIFISCLFIVITSSFILDSDRLVSLRRIVSRRLCPDTNYPEAVSFLALYTACLRAIVGTQGRSGSLDKGQLHSQKELHELIAPIV